MLRNGDFRRSSRSGNRRIPLFWATNQQGESTVVKTAGGKNAVRFKLDPENRGNLIQWGVPLTPGKDYLFSLDYRGPQGAKAMFYVERSGHVLGMRKIAGNGRWSSRATAGVCRRSGWSP